MARPVHPDKDIEAAVIYAESMGWRCELSNGTLGAASSARAAGPAIALFRSGQRPEMPTRMRAKFAEE